METEFIKTVLQNRRYHSLFQFKSMLLPHGCALHVYTVLSVVKRKESQIRLTVHTSRGTAVLVLLKITCTKYFQSNYCMKFLPWLLIAEINVLLNHCFNVFNKQGVGWVHYFWDFLAAIIFMKFSGGEAGWPHG